MPLLPRRFKKLKSVLNLRMNDLTILLEEVDKPHNLSAILRTCDAVGVLEAHAISKTDKLITFNSTSQGSQKWIKLHQHNNIETAVKTIKEKGFQVFGTNINPDSIDYRECDFTGPTAFVLGAEKWGLTEQAKQIVDKSIYIPMRGMVQSLNVSVAASALLFEALRQRELAGIAPKNGEQLNPKLYKNKLFEWAYPEVANWCKKERRSYPELNSTGEIIEKLPRNIKMKS
tara:strand:- start:2155 stop:2844 length:690 start_codon:yes stop_codon:yes gene_type:complete